MSQLFGQITTNHLILNQANYILIHWLSIAIYTEQEQ